MSHDAEPRTAFKYPVETANLTLEYSLWTEAQLANWMGYDRVQQHPATEPVARAISRVAQRYDTNSESLRPPRGVELVSVAALMQTGNGSQNHPKGPDDCEDYISWWPEHMTAVLSDGAGGAQGAKIAAYTVGRAGAARLATEHFPDHSEYMVERKLTELTTHAIDRTLAEVKQNLRQSDDPAEQDAGIMASATGTGLRILDGGLLVGFQVGDSALFLIDPDRNAEQLTEDHSAASEERPDTKNVLTNWFGGEGRMDKGAAGKIGATTDQPIYRRLKPGINILVMTSDGYTGDRAEHARGASDVKRAVESADDPHDANSIAQNIMSDRLKAYDDGAVFALVVNVKEASSEPQPSPVPAPQPAVASAPAEQTADQEREHREALSHRDQLRLRENAATINTLLASEQGELLRPFVENPNWPVAYSLMWIAHNEGITLEDTGDPRRDHITWAVRVMESLVSNPYLDMEQVLADEKRRNHYMQALVSSAKLLSAHGGRTDDPIMMDRLEAIEMARTRFYHLKKKLTGQGREYEE